MIHKNAGTAEQAAVDFQRRELEGLTAGIIRLCDSELEPGEFYPEFLRHTVSALGGVAGAVWLETGTDDIDPAYEFRLDDVLPDRDGESWMQHRNLVDGVFDRGEPALVMPQSKAAGERQQNPTDLRLLFAPLHDGARTVGVVEVLQHQTAATDAHRAYVRYLVSVCDAAGRWLRAQSLRELQRAVPRWRRQQEFCRIVHTSLDLQVTAFAIANEARRMIDCDRVSVAVCRGSRCVIEAVSGQDVIDRRSNLVRRLSKLVNKVVAAGEELWHAGSTEELCPQIESVLHDYTEESSTKSLAVIPLREPGRGNSQPTDAHETPFDEEFDSGEIIGALVVEQIHGVLCRHTIEPKLEAVRENSALALSNALEHNSLFLMPLWRTLGRAGRMFQGRALPKTLAVVAFIAAAVAALVLVPAELTLPARGTLEPRVTQSVYAAQSGVIRRVTIQSGDWVEAGQTLVELDNPELRGEYERVRGDRQSAAEQLRAVRIRRLRATGLSAADRVSLAGEQDRLEVRVASLDEELSLLEAQLAELRVESPIRGRVATWDVDQLLRDRPVKPGQELLTLYDPDQGWQLELNVADRRLGHLTKALQRNEDRQQVEVSYVLATDPASVCSGFIQQVQPVTEVHESEGHSVRIEVLVDPEAAERSSRGLKPGTTVMGEVHCGQRSLGYVWLHEALEAAQRFWFRLF